MRTLRGFEGKRGLVLGGWTVAVLMVLTAMTLPGCGYSRPEDVAALGEAAPEVIQAEPAPNSAGVEPDAAIRIRFSKPVDPVSAAVTVEAAGLPVDGIIEVVNGDTVEFRPSAALAKGMPFAVTVTHIADLANNASTTPYTYDFTTVTTACVRPGGAGGCFALPSTAVAAASAGDSIAVAAGMYMDNVVIDRTVNVLGGYNDTLSLRDAKTYVTTIRALSSDFSIVRIDTRSGDALNTAVVDGLTLTGNTRDEHGAGLASFGSSPRIRNNVISANISFLYGGGVHIQGGFAHLARNRIEDNALLASGDGAGFHAENATVELFDNLIINNKIPATDSEGSGGGIGVTSSTVVLRNNRIEGNQAAGYGRLGRGGGVSVRSSRVTISGGTISGNKIGSTTGTGGGLYVSTASEVRVDGVAFRGNIGADQATAGASGIHAEASRLVVASSIIAGNRSGIAGISLGATGTYIIVNCTIADNTARGVHAQSAIAMANSIVAQESIGVERVGAQANAFYSNVFFDVTSNVVGATLDTSNRTLDPRLDAELHLTADSPLIDAGRAGPLSEFGFFVDPPAIDIDGQVRPVPGRAGSAALPDIGADEYHP